MSIKIHVVPVTSYQQNCSILQCDQTNDIAIIDPGGDVEKILTLCKTIGGRIRLLLLTHGHLDHVGASRKLANDLKLPLLGPHRADQYWLDRLELQSQMFGFKTTPAFTPDRYIEENEIINFGHSSLKAIHCPGHTPGHLVFHLEKESLLIAGDVLFKGSIGRTDFPMSSQKDLIQSIKEKLFILNDHTIVYPGHGPTTTIGQEKLTNPYVGVGYE